MSPKKPSARDLRRRLALLGFSVVYFLHSIGVIPSLDGMNQRYVPSGPRMFLDLSVSDQGEPQLARLRIVDENGITLHTEEFSRIEPAATGAFRVAGR